MIDRTTLQTEMARECEIIKHLASKVPPGTDDWRPTEGQRSMLEFLRYVSFCGIGGARAMAEGDWAGYGEVEARAADLTREGFAAAMDRQSEELAALVEGLSDAQWSEQECTLPWGEKVPMWKGIFETGYRWLAGYRMQLFLYAKGAGNTEISTANVWVGIDWTPPEA